MRGCKHRDWADDVVPVDELVVDGNLVTSRKPGDLPAFNREVIKLFGRSRHNQRADATAAGVTAAIDPAGPAPPTRAAADVFIAACTVDSRERGSPAGR